MTQHVAILLCTYNGADHLDEQLASFAAQTHEDWSLWISDDGSTDATLDIVRRFQAKMPDREIVVVSGPEAGFQQNFMSLAQRDIAAQYFAISDQDDIWLPNKLEHAIEVLKTEQADLYGGRTKLITADGAPCGYSPIFEKPPRFENALVQSIAGGNTMVLTRAAIDLLRRSPTTDVVSHDWWIYLIISGAGLKVHYDSTPLILYRQHGNNIVGANNNWRARLKRVGRLFEGLFKTWNDRNIACLRENQSQLTDAAVAQLDIFEQVRGKKGLSAILALRNSGFYRQTTLGQLGLYAGAFFGRI